MNKDHEYREKLMHTNGTTALETISVIVPSFFYTFLTILITTLALTFRLKSKTFQFILEFILLVIPIILNITILPKYSFQLIITYFVIIISLLLVIYSLKQSYVKNTSIIKDESSKSFITNARSTINVISVIAILAVDFKVFPRTFAKTEFYGFSLMDVGVGLFVYSNGIISPEVRGQKDSVLKSLKSSVPLIILGTARFFLTKSTDYHVPVSEYGVHWNFFITLAFTKILTSLIMNVVEIKYIIINAVLLMISHEILLQAGLANLVLKDGKRTNFILANKEGLVSSLGYVSLYLFSVYFGYFLNIKNSLNKLQTCTKFIALSIITLFLTFVLEHQFGISRRLANSAYCFWILFIGIFMTGLYYLGELICDVIYRNKPLNCVYSPSIYEAINYNGLTFFLVSNVVTGLINLMLDTLKVDDVTGLGIISLYMFVNCFVIWFLYQKQIKLKL